MYDLATWLTIMSLMQLNLSSANGSLLNDDKSFLIFKVVPFSSGFIVSFFNLGCTKI